MPTMPSSPPRRIHSRPESRRSSDSSHYSFHLDALMPPDEHESSSLVVQSSNRNAIDVIHSEDIDGPTDFTQNMEYWMSTKLPTVVEPTKLEGAPKKDMEEYVGSDDTESTTKHMPSKHDNPLDQPSHLDESDISITTPTRAYTASMAESLFNDFPLGNESTPRTVEPAPPPSRPVTRQATVEDYEDTPVRPREISSAYSSPTGADHRLPESTGPSETEKALERALEQLREELASIRNQMEEQSHRQSKDLTETKATYETKLAQLQSHPGDAGLEQARLLDESEGLHKQKDAQIRHLQARAADQDEKLEEAQREIVTLGSELEELGNDKARIENGVLVLQKKHDVLQDNAVKLEQTMRELEVQAELATASIKDLKEHIDCIQGEHIEKSQQFDRLQEESAALRANVAELRAEHRQEILRIEAEADETVTNALETYSREEKRLHSKLEASSAQVDLLTKERDLLVSKFKDQKSKHSKSQSDCLSTIAALEAKVKELSTTNATMTAELQSTTRDLSKARQQVKIAEFETNAALREKQKINKELDMTIEKTEAINAQFDKAIDEMLREKEREWRARYADLKKEKSTMGKVLMKEWGEKECGTMEPEQGYRYKYV